MPDTYICIPESSIASIARALNSGILTPEQGIEAIYKLFSDGRFEMPQSKNEVVEVSTDA